MENQKILIVDDDPDLRRALRIRLQANHYDTVQASDGYTAMSVAQKERPNLIILDLGLPAGDGFVVLERFRVNPAISVTPVIVVSGRDAYANKERALKAGAKAFVQKPWNDNELLAIIAELLGYSETATKSGEYRLID